MKTKNNKIYDLTVEEAIELLQSSDMANYKTNIEFTKLTHGGNNHDGRKRGSKNKMTVAKLAVIVTDFIQEQRKFNKYILETLERHELILKQNSLFQERVLETLERHELIFKRNNLK